MSIIDNFNTIHGHFKSSSGKTEKHIDHQGWNTSDNDWKYDLPTVALILRRGSISLEPQLLPHNVYREVPTPFDPVILSSVNNPAGEYILKKTAASLSLFNYTIKDMPDVNTVDCPSYLKKKLKGKSKTINWALIKNVQTTIMKRAHELIEVEES